VGMRRARRLDLWMEGGLLRIDAGFQDSGTTPSGERRAVHEYRLRASADPATLELLAIVAEPRILPYRECPAAAGNVGRLVGTSIDALRELVPVQLAGAAGCTHLNDVARSLSDVPALAARLRDHAGGEQLTGYSGRQLRPG